MSTDLASQLDVAVKEHQSVLRVQKQSDFVTRLEAEVNELQDRFNRLNAFLGSTATSALDYQMHTLMVQQKYVMMDYIDILRTRLDLLREPEDVDPQSSERSAVNANRSLERGLSVPDDVESNTCSVCDDNCPCEK